MNFFQSDVPEASLNRRLPAYETYRPRFDAACLHIACIECHYLIPNEKLRIKLNLA